MYPVGTMGYQNCVSDRKLTVRFRKSSRLFIVGAGVFRCQCGEMNVIKHAKCSGKNFFRTLKTDFADPLSMALLFSHDAGECFSESQCLDFLSDICGLRFFEGL